MSDDLTEAAESDGDDGPNSIGLIASLIVLVVFVLLWFVSSNNPGTFWTLLFLLSQVALISVVIWQACDPFADAAQWIGEAFRLPGSVRGATLDAIASSMPELFSGIFFVIVAISAANDLAAVDGNNAEEQQALLEAAGAEGYGSTIATCAGSAIYNMILIPAICALVISYTRKNRPTIDVEDEVISRDGLWFVGCEMLLILFLFQNQMMWWMGAIFLGLYGVYVFQLYRDAKKYRRKMHALKGHFEEHGLEVEVSHVVSALGESGVRVSQALVLKAREEASGQNGNGDEDEEDEAPESAGVAFGYINVPLNHGTVWAVILLSTLLAAAACYFLVEATWATAEHLEVPKFFVAVILAAAASSVPDTFLAIGAARRDDDSGAVSNAFGSNIFDICICLSIPLFVNSYLTGWQPVSLLQNGQPIPGLVNLRILLVVLTVATLVIMWHNRQLTRNKAIGLVALYCVFVAYAVHGSLTSRAPVDENEEAVEQVLREQEPAGIEPGLADTALSSSIARNTARLSPAAAWQSNHEDEIQRVAVQLAGVQQPGAARARQPGGVQSI